MEHYDDSYYEKQWCPQCGAKLPCVPGIGQREFIGFRNIAFVIFAFSFISMALSILVIYWCAESISSFHQEIDSQTSIVNGDVVSQVDELQQQIGSLTSIVNGDVVSRVDELQQTIGNVSLFTSESMTNIPTLKIKFVCVDSKTEAVIQSCSIHLRILDEKPIMEFDIEPNNDDIPIYTQRKLEVIANADGYQMVVEQFEYTDDGTP